MLGSSQRSACNDIQGIKVEITKAKFVKIIKLVTVVLMALAANLAGAKEWREDFRYFSCSYRLSRRP